MSQHYSFDLLISKVNPISSILAIRLATKIITLPQWSGTEVKALKLIV